MPNPLDSLRGGATSGNPLDSLRGSNPYRIGGKADLSSSQGLYMLAQQQGGAVAQAAAELYHPQTSILSTLAAGFKGAFSNFIDTISAPNEIVAGIISPNITVGEALDNHVKTSDVLFGKSDPNASIYSKTGQFLVRTATDILLDPLTYVTFGAGSGFLGLRSTAEIALGAKAGAETGLGAYELARLSTKGQDIFTTLQKVESQVRGDTAYQMLKTGDHTLDLAGEELQKLLKLTVDSELRPDYAKQAMTNLLENSPSLARDLIDKGGIKFFGQSILSGQRISIISKMIPGMTKLDEVTQQSRYALQSLFNTNIIKDQKGVWTRLPSGMVEFFQKGADLLAARGDTKMKSLESIVNAHNLSDVESEFLTAAVEHSMMPRDPRLAKAMQDMLGYSETDWQELVKSGHLSKEVRLENFVPHISVKANVGRVGFGGLSQTTGATQLRKVAKYTNAKTGEAVTGHADALGLTSSGVNDNIFHDAAGNEFTRSVEPIHKIATPEEFDVLEGTLLKNEKEAAKMLNDMRQDGFRGFDPNITTAWAARGLKNTKATFMREFLHEAGQQFGKNAKEADSRFVRINAESISRDTATISMLGKDGELVFHPAFAARVEEMGKSIMTDDATLGFLKTYDSLQNMWKATVTSIFPAFHGRNAISNVFNNFLDIGLHAMNPRIHTVASQMIYWDRQLNKLATHSLSSDVSKADAAKSQIAQLLQKEAFVDVSGHSWSVGELRQVAKNNNIAFTTKSGVASSDTVAAAHPLFALDSAKDIVTGAHGASAGARVKAAATYPFRKGQDVVGKSIEDQARMVNFIANLRKTGDVTMAARRTKQFLFDYSNLTNFEKNVMKRLIPFYTFTRKNLELQARTLLTAPGRVSAEVHAIGTLGEIISGGQQLTDEEKKALPDWIKSGIGVLAQRHGNQVTLLQGFSTPLEQPFQALQANQLLGSISPLVRLPVEQLAGYSFYQGKPLSEVTNASAFQRAPKVVQDLIGFTKISGKNSNGQPYTWYVSLHPEMMNLVLNLPPTTRVFGALKQMDAVDVPEQAKIIQQLTGVKPYSFDLEHERAKREKEMMNKLEDLLTKAHVTAQFSRTFIPKKQKSALFTQ